jgi:hypothetical protein
MKKTILFLLLIGILPLAHAQNYGFKQIDSSARYCLIMATERLLSKKVVVDIDFGQEKFFLRNTTRLLDSLGNAINFNSSNDAINFMSSNGWEFVTAYAITMSSGVNVYHYLMRRRD